jgi:hypothetical protein
MRVLYKIDVVHQRVFRDKHVEIHICVIRR